jgi:uncharacterized protein (TIGR04255 family)
MAKPLPIKLGREPLLEAICQMNFVPGLELSGVLPGYLYAKLPGVKQVEMLPASQIPEQLRKADPALQLQPLCRVHWEDFFILIAAESVAVAAKLPYVGWSRFKEKIVLVFGVVLMSPFMQGTSVQRYSMKYINLLESSDLAEQHRMLDWSVQCGQLTLNDEITQLRFEKRGEFTNVVAIATSVEVQVAASKKQGVLLDVDTISRDGPFEIEAFRNQLADRLEQLRQDNKRTVFDILTDTTIASLEPQYE